ncbi:DUF2637 domain-containing protein, partial [Streptomyces cyaneofuscatus]
GRIADITADKHMEGVRLTRWLLSPIPTFKLWRRMKLWELRSYEQVIKLEQERLIYQARLQARFGRNWRRKAPVESMMPLRLAKYGVPLAETAPAGLAAAGIEPALLPPAPKAELPYEPRREQDRVSGLEQSQEHGYEQGQGREEQVPQQEQAQPHPQQHPQQQQPTPLQKQGPQQLQAQAQLPEQAPQVPPTHDSPWFAAQKLPEGPHASAYDPLHAEGLEPTPAAVPLGPGRTRPLGNVGTIGAVPHPRREEPQETPEAVQQAQPVQQAADEEPPAVPAPGPEDAPQLEEWSQEDNDFADRAYEEFSAYTDEVGEFPNVETLDIHLADRRDVHHPRSTALLLDLMPQFKNLYMQRATADQSA